MYSFSVFAFFFFTTTHYTSIMLLVLENVWILEHVRIELFGLGMPDLDKQEQTRKLLERDVVLCISAV